MTSIDTVNDLPPRDQYVASAAQTSFPYTFPIFSDSDIAFEVDGDPAALDVDYTVAGEGDDLGGTITWIGAAFTGGEIVTIYRDIPIERDTDIAQNGPWSSVAYNNEMDKIFLLLQQEAANVRRALRLPITAVVDDADLELDPVAFASKYLSFDANGKPVPASLTPATLTAAIITTLLTASTTDQDAILALLRERTDTTPGLDSLERTAAEIARSVTPVNYAYIEGDARRYFASIPQAGTNYYGWFCYGDAITALDADTLRVTGRDATADYPYNSRILLVGASGVQNARVLSDPPVFAAGNTTFDVQFDEGGSMPASMVTAARQIFPRSDNLFNTSTYNANLAVTDSFINDSNTGAAARRLIIGARNGGFILSVTGSQYTATSGSILVGSGVSGRQVVLQSSTGGTAGVTYTPVVIGVGDVPVAVFGSAAAPGTLRLLGATELLRLQASGATGNGYISFYRSDNTTRKGQFGFNQADDNIRLLNEETGGSILITANATGALQLVCAANVNINTNRLSLSTQFQNFANDAAAAVGGINVRDFYRNGSIVMQRVA